MFQPQKIKQIVNLKSFVVIIITLLFLWYSLSRYSIAIIYSSSLYVILFYFIGKKINKNFLFFILVLLTLGFLIFSYFNFRWFSWDGKIKYLRNVLLLKDHFPLKYFEFPLYPYLSELFLAIILKLFGLRVMNLMFGIAVIATLFLSYHFYSLLKLSKFVKKGALFILLSSPTFIYLAIYEYKTDFFLLAMALISYIAFFKYYTKPNQSKAISLGIALALTTLIKITFLISSLAIIGTIFIKEIKKFRTFKLSLLLSAFFIIPIFLWSFLCDSTLIPGLYFQGSKNKNNISLTRNKAIFRNCLVDDRRIDYEHWFPDEKLSDKLLQPYFFIINASEWKVSKADPGLFIYISIFLFCTIPLFVKKNKFKFFGPLYIITLANFVPFFLYIRTVLWYLFPIFPIIAITIPYLIEKHVKKKQIKNLFIIIIAISFVSHLPFPILKTLYNWESPQKIDGNFKNQELKEIYNLSKYLEKKTENKLILYAAHRYKPVPLTFLKNYDIKVIEDHYYFASSNKSLNSMREEFLEKNIGFIVTNTEMFGNEYYQGCPKTNSKILKVFLETYTEPIYSFKEKNVVFKIK